MFRYRDVLLVPRFREIFNNIAFIILLYLYIFQPPVVSKYVFIGIELIVFVLLVIFSKSVRLGKYFRLFRFELSVIITLICYVGVKDLFKGEEVLSVRFIAWFFQSFIFGFLIIELVNRKNFKYGRLKFNIFNGIFWASFIASLFTIVLVSFPQLDTLYKSIQKDEYYNLYENFEQRYRAYGISENLTFTYSYVLGFFAGYILLVLKKNIYLFIPLLTFLYGVTYNARIGFVAVLLFLIYSLFLRREYKSILAVVGITFLAYAFVGLISPNFISNFVEGKGWAFQFFYQISNYVFGTNYHVIESGDTVGVLLNDFIHLPTNGVDWIFGSTVNLFEMPRGKNSDIGYIIQLNYGGIILLLLLLAIVCSSFVKLIKTRGFKWYALIFLFSILILNFKGFVFAATPGGRMLFFLFIFFTVKDRFGAKINI